MNLEDYKIPAKMANSHIYKQAGNSVTVIVIERIAKNIMKAINDAKHIDAIDEVALGIE